MKNIQKSIIRNNSSILEAMRIINSNKKKIALIVDENGGLIGTVTDGDIRRAILTRKDLQTDVSEIMNKDFFASGVKIDYELIKKVMLKKGINCVPIIDENKRPIDLVCSEEFDNQKPSEVRVIIMAGGKGTRLKPYTENCPKPMINICGKPMLELILEKCVSLGFAKFYFSVNYLKEQIIEHFGNGNQWGVDIKYLVESQALGTAGSLSLFEDFNNEPILVMNADVLTSFNFHNMLDFHNKNKLNATLSVREEMVNFPFGIVETNGINLKSFKEKPSIKKLVNTGVYVLSENIFSLIKKNEFCDMPDLLLNCNSLHGKVGVFPIHEYWIDVGRPETLDQAKKEWNEINKNV